MNQHYIKLYEHKYLIDVDISELLNIKKTCICLVNKC